MEYPFFFFFQMKCHCNVFIGRCSLYGLWGNATLGGKTLQLRALDWDVDGGLQDYPVITIYHPTTSKLGHPFANVAWAGM
jgi:exportin-7